MQEYSYEFKLPKERIAVAIGTQGRIKKQIEKLSKAFIAVDSAGGDVTITGTDMLGLYAAKEILTAIGRGFNPEVALLLARPENMFEQLQLNQVAKTPKHLQRIRGRVIGTDGKTRRYIENLTDCSISIFGKTVGIIGSIETVPLARKAIEMLVKGSQHHAVYTWLEKQRRILKEKQVREAL